MKAVEAAGDILEFAPLDMQECTEEFATVTARFLDHIAIEAATLDEVGNAEPRRVWTRCTFEHRWRVARQLAERFCDDYWQAMNDLRPGEAE